VDAPVHSQKLTAGVNAPINLYLNTAYALRAQDCWFFGSICDDRTVSGSNSEQMTDILIADVLPATLDEFIDVAAWGQSKDGSLSGGVRFLDPDGDGLLARSAGGLDPDNTKWDTDGDGLSDGYEVWVRSQPFNAGGANLDPQSADSDNDGLRDDVELRFGTDPGKADSDGDGLSDIAEVAPAGGWELPYRYNPASGQVTTTHVWSDPLQAGADGDGLSDRIEQAQLTCATCDPWADPKNPQVNNPNVWNESPLALYVSNNAVDNVAPPGASIVYTSTTVNDLSSGQRVVGERALDLPDAFSGAPLSAQVDVQRGNRQSLVSLLNVTANQSGKHELTSEMGLTNFDRTLWKWDQNRLTDANTVHGAIQEVAVAQFANTFGRLLIVTREVAGDGSQAIAYYQIWADGTVEKAGKLYSASAG
jgi:Bacterial TSP3 repeat